ncbi:helix-turn-helix domain-containing protein [Sphingomonas hengshuiensis]|uniref:HTH luxR-type domain-containing protein n=1 Tax=Sphingomonas hengshuiensis TaxID=1609977 RepID=A0A7U4JAS9_9SPHN|nr:hypothetical protein [Sphingomonas hengshuiensis]AJP73396.1 hypothetical protein TS85_18740 [Sphingomonas hengshuiensis]
MGDDPRALLTESQLACLRLVHVGSSKRIAQVRGGSHHTIDHHIKGALSRLGLEDRDTAAALIRDWDRRDSQDLATPSPPIVYTPPEPAEAALADAENTGSINQVADVTVPYVIQLPPERQTLLDMLGEFEPAKLNAASRMALATAIALAMTMLMGGLSLFLAGILTAGRALLN